MFKRSTVLIAPAYYSYGQAFEIGL